MSAPDELLVWENPRDGYLTIVDKTFVPQAVRYIRAPESAAQPTVGRLDQSVGQPTASPAHLPESAARNALAIAMGGWMHRFDNAPTMEVAQRISRAWCEWMLSNKYSILGALRALKPGNAVPREPTREMTIAGNEAARGGFTANALWRAMHDAATKAGEGET